MQVKEFIDILLQQDPTDDVCIFSIRDGARYIVSEDMIDTCCSGSIDINLEYAEDLAEHEPPYAE